jgi:hypothetical protein
MQGYDINPHERMTDEKMKEESHGKNGSLGCENI